MRVLLDENLPVDLAAELAGHDVAYLVGKPYIVHTSKHRLQASASGRMVAPVKALTCFLILAVFVALTAACGGQETAPTTPAVGVVGSPTPVPTTATIARTAIPTPTATLFPTETLAPTPVPVATPTPTSAPMPLPTATPVPTPTAIPIPTPTATLTPTLPPSPTPEAAPVPLTVNADMVNFTHMDLTVEVGTTVLWTNLDRVQHTVTSGNPSDPDPGSLFDSGSDFADWVVQGGMYFFTFNEAGTFPYYCRVHGASMSATITVTGAQAATAVPAATAAPVPTATPITPAVPQGILWTRQFGTDGYDDVQGAAVDGAGNLYVVGRTGRALPGQTSLGGFSDAYIRKYDSKGNEQWTRQFGTKVFDSAVGVAVNSAGYLYVAGRTASALPGQTNLGDSDAYVRKYDSNGNEQWTRQFGSQGAEFAQRVAVDSVGNLYVSGQTTGVLPGQTASLPKSTGFSTDNDAYVRKYDPNGNELWTRQFGTPSLDFSSDVAVDGAGNLFVAGGTEGSLPGNNSLGDFDAYVRKYDSKGNELWTRQFGSQRADFTEAVGADGTGNLYVVGRTEGDLPGQTNLGLEDAFVLKMSAGP